ncbi:MauE/DoxX family redox-associated membrane protein [Desulfocurvus sp. DL9XJH121]
MSDAARTPAPSHHGALARMLRRRGILAVIRLGLALVFVWAGAVKLMAPEAFALAIDGYGLVPWRLARVLSVALPVLEIASGLGLACKRRGALALITGQLALFMGVLGYGILGGLEADCGCFGLGDAPPVGTGELRLALARDAVMLVGCVWLYAAWPRPKRAAGTAR